MGWELAGTAILIGHLVAAAAWDLSRRRIPNLLTGSLAVTGLLAAWLQATPDGMGLGMAALSMAVAFTLFRGLRLLAAAVSPHSSLGGGDIKLLAGTAAWLGLPSIVLASVAASAALLVFALTRGMGWHERLPFAPPFTLAVGLLLATASLPGL